MIVRRKNYIIDIDDLSLVDNELLKIHSKIENFNDIKNICIHHKNNFIRDYSNNHKKCSDPFKIHKSTVKTNLHIVTLGEYKKTYNSLDILPGQKICRNCNHKLFTSKENDEGKYDVNNSTMDIDHDMSVETATELVNESLEMFECSPLKWTRSDRALNVGKRKLDDVQKKLSNAVAIALNQPDLSKEKTCCKNCKNLVCCN